MRPLMPRVTLFAAILALGGSAVATSAALPAADTDGWIKLFNGKDLSGWDGDPGVWRVEDGCIVGRAESVPANTFLIYGEPVADFTLRVRFKMTEKGRYPNSGVQYRSKVRDAAAHAVVGYQADICDGHWADVHEEGGRPTLAKGSEEAAKAVRRGDWNEYEITAVGPVLTHRVNGVLAARFEESDAKRGATSGVLALQYHKPGDGFEIRFQDVRIKLLDARGNPVAPAPGRAAARRPVPAADAQAAARKQVRSLFAAAYADQTPAGRTTLAAKLLTLAAETAEDPAQRFVLLSEARDVAAAGGDVQAALGAVDLSAAQFAVDALAAKSDVLAAAAAVPPVAGSRAAARAGKLAVALSDEAVKAERYELAERLLAIAEAAGRKATDGVTEAKARRRLADVRDLALRRDRATAAERVLDQSPDDAAANAAVGAYRCFVRQDWAGGLPLLAKGSDAALASLAWAELGAPQTANGRLGVAAQWWDAAERLAERDRAAYRRRAGQWYEAALPGLAGLPRALAENRLAELAPTKRVTTGSVDLLELVDADTDAVSGDWQRSGKGLLSGAGQAQRIALPAASDGGYELTVRFVRQAGSDAVLVYLPAGKGGTMLVLSGWGNQTTALYNVNGRRAAEVLRMALVNGREYRVDARVLLEGENADVTVRLDGTQLLHWNGHQSALMLDERWSLPNPKCFALGAVEKTSFTAVMAKPVTGGITRSRP